MNQETHVLRHSLDMKTDGVHAFDISQPFKHGDDPLRLHVRNVAYVEFVDVSGSDQAIVDAARVSYAGKGKSSPDSLIRYLWRNGHVSPFEMASLKLKVIAPVFIARQWMRHKSMSFNEQSGRYATMLPYVHFPFRFHKQSSGPNKQASGETVFDTISSFALDACLKNAHDSWNLYNTLLEQEISREEARMVLPVTQFTSFIAYGNLRSWLHFIQARSHAGAQWQMTMYAEAVAAFVEEHFPISAAAAGIVSKTQHPF